MLCLIIVFVLGLAFCYVHSLLAFLPAVAYLVMLFSRRKDPVGILLFMTLLTLQAGVLYAFVWLASMQYELWQYFLPPLLASLLILKEFHRFLDNEYGDGRAARRLGLLVLLIAAVCGQLALTWFSQPGLSL